MTAVQKPYKGLGMEGVIASWYAKNTGRNLTRFHDNARLIAGRLPQGGAVLEVAPGPGYMAIELARDARFRVTGLDISASFVRIASDNATRAGVRVDFQRGDAAHMPFPSDTFDYVTCSAAFKNFSDPLGAIDEIYRVLAPGGQASIFDLRHEATLEEIDRDVSKMQLSRLNAAFTRLTFRSVLLKNAYTREQLLALSAQSHFRTADIQDNGIEFEWQLRKPKRADS